MPTIFYSAGYRFFFYSYDLNEPPHIHVDRDNKLAKYWLEPISLAYNRKYNDHELNEIVRIIRENLEVIRERWNEHYNRKF